MSRINPRHEMFSILKNAYAARSAGYAGEIKVDQIFQNYTFPMKHKVFNGLSLTSSTSFQIDTLFITPAFAVVLETKNLAGAIKVKDNPPQLIQKLDNGDTKVFTSPVLQVQSNMELLQDWFYGRNISLPIYGAVVLAFPKKEVELINIDFPFLYPSGIPSFIRKLPTDTQPLDPKSFSFVIQELLQNDTEYIPQPICSIYAIPEKQISTGVACPSCGFLGMAKYKSGWRCLACPQKSRDAHNQAILDWFLLFDNKITNQDCRNFLEIPTHSTATRILQSMQLHTEGEKRNRTYSRPPI